MNIVKYTAELCAPWEAFLERCTAATFLHSRAFLSYHQDRFQDESLLVYEEEKLIALLPAARDFKNNDIVISHPGSTYGGLLIPSKVNAVGQLEVFRIIFEYYQKQGIRKFLYKPVPGCFKTAPGQEDHYAMFYYGASLIRRDLNCVIPLQEPSILSGKDASKMRNMLRKAEKTGLSISFEEKHLGAFYHLLNWHLQQKYATRPTHSEEELVSLFALCPQHLLLITAFQGQDLLSGILLFVDKNWVHTQYMVVSEAGRECFALDYAIQASIDFAKEEQKQFFSFGISNEHAGKVLNAGLYLSKVKHGGVGYTHDVYTLDLGEALKCL